MQAAKEGCTSNLITILELGDGHQAKVYSARLQNSPTKAATTCVKVFDLFDGNKDQLLNAETEAKIGKLLYGHQNIIQIYSFERNQVITIDGQKQKRDFMKMELCENGDLFDFMCQYSSTTSTKGLVKYDMPLMKSLFI